MSQALILERILGEMIRTKNFHRVKLTQCINRRVKNQIRKKKIEKPQRFTPGQFDPVYQPGGQVKYEKKDKHQRSVSTEVSSQIRKK